MLPLRSISSVVLLVFLGISAVAAMVSPAIGAGGAWPDGVLNGEPGDIAIVAMHPGESPAEVSSSVVGAGARTAGSVPRKSVRMGAPAIDAASPHCRLYVLNCVFII